MGSDRGALDRDIVVVECNIVETPVTMVKASAHEVRRNESMKPGQRLQRQAHVDTSEHRTTFLWSCIVWIPLVYVSVFVLTPPDHASYRLRGLALDLVLVSFLPLATLLLNRRPSQLLLTTLRGFVIEPAIPDHRLLGMPTRLDRWMAVVIIVWCCTVTIPTIVDRAVGRTQWPTRDVFDHLAVATAAVIAYYFGWLVATWLRAEPLTKTFAD